MVSPPCAVRALVRPRTSSGTTASTGNRQPGVGTRRPQASDQEACRPEPVGKQAGQRREAVHPEYVDADHDANSPRPWP